MKLACIFLLQLLFLLFSFHASALNFSSTVLRLNCPERGLIEIILHVYEHTQEAWTGNFETGAGHQRIGDIEMVPFANGDTLIHQVSTDSFGYVYNGEERLKHCVKLDEQAVYPSFG